MSELIENILRRKIEENLLDKGGKVIFSLHTKANTSGTMYKTIRHGENSLQYTILPQHDDYSKGAPSLDGNKAQTGSSMAKSNRNNKKRSLMAYIGLFFICSIITGAILVPLMVSVEVMSSPKDWFYKHTLSGGDTSSRKTPFTSKDINITQLISTLNKTYGGGIDTSNKRPLNNGIKIDFPLTSSPVAQLDHVVIGDDDDDDDSSDDDGVGVMRTYSPPSIVASTRDSTIDMVKNSIQSPTAPMASDSRTLPISNDVVTKVPMAISQLVRITLTTTPTTTTTTQSSLLPSEDEIVERKFSKPIISREPATVPEISTMPLLTVVAATVDSIPSTITDIPITKHIKEEKTWIKSHWPIVDPSTYFQWTAYESEDNILLPVMFCAAIMAVIIFVLLCVILRNKKCFSCSRKRNEFLTVEAQNGDNATLLTQDEQLSEDE